MNRVHVMTVLLLGALGLRLVVADRLLPSGEETPPSIPLEELPMNAFGEGWRGIDIPMEKAVQETAHVSSYVQRRYTSVQASFWFYVGYVPGWVPSAIHHPAVCFPGAGYDLERSETVTLECPSVGKAVVFKEFVWLDARRGFRTYTLSTFYYNGKFEPEEMRLRADRVFGVPYFAVITVSGTFLGSLEETRRLYDDALTSALPILLRHFPEEGAG